MISIKCPVCSLILELKRDWVFRSMKSWSERTRESRNNMQSNTPCHTGDHLSHIRAARLWSSHRNKHRLQHWMCAHNSDILYYYSDFICIIISLPKLAAYTEANHSIIFGIRFKHTVLWENPWSYSPKRNKRCLPEQQSKHGPNRVRIVACLCSHAVLNECDYKRTYAINWPNDYDNVHGKPHPLAFMVGNHML